MNDGIGGDDTPLIGSADIKRFIEKTPEITDKKEGTLRPLILIPPTKPRLVAYCYNVELSSSQIKEFSKIFKSKGFEEVHDFIICVDNETKVFSLEDFKQRLGFKT